MALYYFHVETDGTVRDTIGSEHESLQAAKCRAVKMMSEVLCKQPHIYWDANCYRTTITDADNLILVTVEI